MNRGDRNRYLAYVRVSSTEQAERNLSIPSQIEQIQNYAQKNGLIIDKFIKEENSAFKGKRTEFNKMIKELRTRSDLSGIIIFQFSRLSRNSDDFSVIDNIIREKGMNIISVTEPLLNNYMGRYLVRDLQNRAILYSEELSFRIKLGMRKKLQNGGSVGGGIPRGFKKYKGWFIPDEEKSKIIKYIFEIYGTGVLGYKEIAKSVRKEFNLKQFTWKKVERMIPNSIYTGIKTKIWNLSNEEYVFWGAENPGKFKEEYKLNFITPIIDKELFDRCQFIRQNKKRGDYERIGKEKFPRIFSCVCGRKMRRDDKKNIRYLTCSKQINGKHQVKCNEHYINLKRIENKIFEIVRKPLLNKEFREKMIDGIQKQIMLSESDKKYKIIDNLKKIDELKEKQASLTESFINSNISKQIFEISSSRINDELNILESEIKMVENNESRIQSAKKTIKFINILDELERNIDNECNNGKGSQCFGLLFKIVANLVVGSQNIVSYAYNSPFDLLEKSTFKKWWSGWELNPCLESIIIYIYCHSQCILPAGSFSP